MHYLKRHFLAGRHPPERLDDLNRKLRVWLLERAGERIHGTTRERPLERFREVERAALVPLPRLPYDPATWAKLRLYRDCHLTFEQAYYSAPFRCVGEELWVRGGARTVEIYDGEHQLLATHDRAGPGERRTTLAHLPPTKVPGLVLSRDSCRQRARAAGPATATIVDQLLDHRPEDRLRSAGRLLDLAAKVGAERLEGACGRALRFGVGDFPTVKRILEGGLDTAPAGAELSAAAPAAEAAASYMYARPATDFAASLLPTAGMEAGR